MIKAAAICSARDYLPLSFTAKQGMIDFTQVIIDLVRSKTGKFTAKDLLPSKTAVSYGVVDIRDEI